MHQRRYPRSARRSNRLVLVLLTVSLAACTSAASDGRPSIVLFVVDTLRADAVSAYGRVTGTTPNLDRLAAEGLLYTHAYAPAPWTLPSHSSLFTGLRADQHGVGIHGAFRLPDDVSTLAERLRDAGYETAGFSENSIVSHDFNLDQGFEDLRTMSPEDFAREVEQPGSSLFSTVELVGAWAKQRKRDRPFFLFVNVMDAHEPYSVRAKNFFLTPERAPHAASLDQSPRVCARGLTAHDIAVLNGLYLGDVAAADAKAAAVREQLKAAGYEANVITVVTSDHGQLLGEHGLVNHQFSVHEQLLRVPLIVHGLGNPAASIDEPVDLIDVVPSILAWTGVAAASSGLPGRVLPTAARAATDAPRDLVAMFGDWVGLLSREMPAWIGNGANETASARQRTCTPEDHVSGDMVALMRYPYKLIWYQRYVAELYDIRADPDEHDNIAATDPAPLATLQAALSALKAESPMLSSAPAQPGAPDPNVGKALKSLGYVE